MKIFSQAPDSVSVPFGSSGECFLAIAISKAVPDKTMSQWVHTLSLAVIPLSRNWRT